jgi:hypothetical protein
VVKGNLVARTEPLCMRNGKHKGIYRVERNPYVGGMASIRVSIVRNGTLIEKKSEAKGPLSARTVPLWRRKANHKGVFQPERNPYREEKRSMRASCGSNGTLMEKKSEA